MSTSLDASRYQWPFVFSTILSVVSAIAATALTTALPGALDVRPAIIAVSFLAALLSWTARQVAPTAFKRRVTGFLLVVNTAGGAWAGYDVTLAYRTRNVAFQNGATSLFGTIYLPRTAGPHPGVLILHGSGRQTRDEGAFYARRFARHGFVALAFDKRGSGASSGNVRTATYQQLAADAVSAMAVLRSQPETEARRVGIWGVSEAEWVGSLAARASDAAFLVIVSASGMTPSQQVEYETGRRVLDAGFGDVAARDAQQLYGRVSAFQRTGEGRDVLNAELARAAATPWFKSAWYLEASVPVYDEVLKLEWFPAWRQRMDFDALPVLAQYRGPVLVQNGGADQKADGASALDRIRTAVDSSGPARFTGLLYPNAEHGIIEWRLPGRLPPPWFASGYLDDQIEWMSRMAGPRAK